MYGVVVVVAADNLSRHHLITVLPVLLKAFSFTVYFTCSGGGTLSTVLK